MNFIKKRVRSLLGKAIQLSSGSNKILIAQCLLNAQLNRKVISIRDLTQVEFRGFSQWGEDGIIDWLIERLPGIPKTFVEFGVENYLEANTRMLLWLRNWRGLIIDGSEENIADVKKQDVAWRFNLSSVCAFIDKDNINHLIESSGLRGDIGLLSIDIDGNDYWVWKNIAAISPVLVVCEYNAVYGDLKRITTPYKADFRRNAAHFSNLYFGASLPALIDLGKEKGYSFVGTNSNGCNAFFVRNDSAVDILSNLKNIASFASQFRESRDESGQLNFISNSSRLEPIQHMPVMDLDQMKEVALKDLGELYSPEWRSQI